MDKTGNMKETEKRIEVMKAYLEGKAIQCRNKGKEDDYWKNVEHPDWNWIYVDYRVKPDETKKLMTNRQLAELMAKGYGEWSFNGEELVFHTEVGYGIPVDDEELEEDVFIRPWGMKELRKPTVDIYEEYVSKWNRAFSWVNELTKGENKSELRPQDCPQSSGIKDYSGCNYICRLEPKIGEVFRFNGLTLRCEEGGCVGCALINFRCYAFKCSEKGRKDGKSVHFVDVSKTERTTASEDSSSTQEECIGVHKRTPQEIADFFNCYVAMSGKNEWLLYEKEPCIVNDHWSSYYEIFYLGYKSNCFFLLAPEDHNWKTLYRPHMEPLVKEEEDD